MDWFMNNFKMIQWVIWIFFALIIWALAVTFVKRKEHSASNEKHKTARDELAGRVAKIEDTYSTTIAHTQLAQKVNTLETQIKELPSSRTIHSLEKEVGELKGSVDGMKDLLSNINNHVNMLVENEIKG
jgi:cell division protein FtsI/penicillin-binding protein 2